MDEAPSLQRIDAHLHFWHYSAQDYPWIGEGMQALAVDCTPEQVLPQLEACGLTGAIAVQARGSVDETRYLLDLARRRSGICGVVGWEDLACDGIGERLQSWRAEPALCGWRHQVQDEPDASAFLRSAAFARGLSVLQRQGWAYDVLVFDHQMDAAAALCVRHDAHWMVLDHLGKPPLAGLTQDQHKGQAQAAFGRWQALLQRFAPLSHVACKLSGLVTEADWRSGLREPDRACLLQCLDTALQVFGPQRLMFGSDWPVCLLAAPYATVFELVDGWASSRLSASEREALWGGTAARCYGLQPQGMT
ncbi:L-fuconolactonase [Delftia sp. 60]|uniref:amidohydrolase family protein n=1 Tax=Delftia sp. 60 TaxID=2035216 RepID=UPI000C19478C|nr:amidohydrolase family protein [Delftia sp. 60]PIF38961.1 L-fuconolactonase [Burkholderiales bacterium 23]PIF65859.1 L-fuconolactonase [Delftia sp. 60]